MLTSNPTQPTFVPALESGDRLTRTEFERRYQLHPAIKKAELIEGAPELVAEIAASSASYDLYDKLNS